MLIASYPERMRTKPGVTRATSELETAKKLRANKRGQELAQGGTRGLSRKIIACFAILRRTPSEVLCSNLPRGIHSMLHLPLVRRRGEASRIHAPRLSPNKCRTSDPNFICIKFIKHQVSYDSLQRFDLLCSLNCAIRFCIICDIYNNKISFGISESSLNSPLLQSRQLF